MFFKGKIIVNGEVIEKECNFFSREKFKIGDIVCVSGIGFAIVTSLGIGDEYNYEKWYGFDFERPIRRIT